MLQLRQRTIERSRDVRKPALDLRRLVCVRLFERAQFGIQAVEALRKGEPLLVEVRKVRRFDLEPAFGLYQGIARCAVAVLREPVRLLGSRRASRFRRKRLLGFEHPQPRPC